MLSVRKAKKGSPSERQSQQGISQLTINMLTTPILMTILVSKHNLYLVMNGDLKGSGSNFQRNGRERGPYGLGS